MGRVFICSESLVGASYGHGELYYDEEIGFVIDEEHWGSVDDAEVQTESRPVSDEEAVKWTKRHVADADQLQKALNMIDRYAGKMNENAGPVNLPDEDLPAKAQAGAPDEARHAPDRHIRQSPDRKKGHGNMNGLEEQWDLYMPFGKVGDFTQTRISVRNGVVRCRVEIHQDLQGTCSITRHCVRHHERDFRLVDDPGSDELRQAVASFADQCIPYPDQDETWKEKDWKDRFLALLRSEGVFDPQKA